jgi:hypothetical protein
LSAHFSTAPFEKSLGLLGGCNSNLGKLIQTDRKTQWLLVQVRIAVSKSFWPLNIIFIADI